MIEIENSRFGIPFTYIWFAERPSRAAALRPVTYMHCAHLGDVMGFARAKKFTKIIDLREPPESILKGMSKNTSYKVKRAQREGVTLRAVEERDDFLRFYNAFAQSKRRATIGAGQLAAWGRETVALAAVQDDAALAMHSYVVDPLASRACLMHSASHFRYSDDSKARNAIARANRLLHYLAMRHFKDQGIEKYDMGGYAKDTTDPELETINRFKDGFGGALVEESTFYSYPMRALQIANRLRGAR